MKQVENEWCQGDAANNTSAPSLGCHMASYLIFYCCCVVHPPLFFLTVILCPLRLLHWCPRVPGENKTELNSASVFRCTNGTTEAKMAGGERWVHREQHTAPHHCCCCRSAKPLDCDGMGSVCVYTYVWVWENEGEEANEWEVLYIVC